MMMNYLHFRETSKETETITLKSKGLKIHLKYLLNTKEICEMGADRTADATQ